MEILNGVAMASIYERNFDRLMTLLPTLAEGESCTTLGRGVRRVRVEVLERHKFTTIVHLCEPLPVSLTMVGAPTMTVRVYHDVEVAEVLSYQNQGSFHPKYNYPNAEMLQVREKRRVNEFLGEWLEFCLVQSRVFSASALR